MCTRDLAGLSKVIADALIAAEGNIPGSVSLLATVWCTDNFTQLSQAISLPADQLIMMSSVAICSIVYRVYRSMEGSRCPCALGCRNDVERCLAQSGCAVKHSILLPNKLGSSQGHTP